MTITHEESYGDFSDGYEGNLHSFAEEEMNIILSIEVRWKCSDMDSDENATQEEKKMDEQTRVFLDLPDKYISVLEKNELKEFGTFQYWVHSEKDSVTMYKVESESKSHSLESTEIIKWGNDLINKVVHECKQ